MREVKTEYVWSFRKWCRDVWAAADGPPTVLCAILLIAALVPTVGFYIASSKERAEFMEACLADRKKYECVAMWRGGGSVGAPTPVIVPIR